MMIKANTYRRKPEEVKAVVFTGKNSEDIEVWTGGVAYTYEGQLFVTTFEGPLVITPGDYVVQCRVGEYCPCRPDLFELTYDLVNSLEE